MRAVVDIGSNSVKYTLERTWGDAASRTSRSQVVALGKGLSKGSPLSAEAFLRLETALKSFSADLRPCGKNLVVVGTAALRACSNPDLAALLVQKYLNAKLHLIPGETEARLSFEGAMIESPFKNPLCVDVGGASTEVGVPERHALSSVPWGALRVHENILTGQAPIQRGIWQTAQTQLNQIFCEALPKAVIQSAAEVDGVLAIGGSLVMCARAIDSASSQKSVMSTLTRLREFNQEIAHLSTAERVQKFSLASDRAEIAPAGLMCLLAATSILSPEIDRTLVTEGGLRNGIFKNWEEFAS